MEDIDIARQAQLKPITEITKGLGIEEKYVEPYGKYKAKISNKIPNHTKKAKLILVTAINPTPMGEGKTTVSIGLADGFRKIGKKSILALREPSLGPVFGMKGGATGGGHAQITPMEDINLHFTGDLHAITAANNLLSAMIDNHIYFGNTLNIKEVIWKRCLDVNDRQLRKIECGLSAEKNLVPRTDGFDITAASEIMAIFCLATDETDLKRRLGNIVIGYNEDEKPVYAKELKAEGAMAVLLKEAISPNIVQTLEGTPAIVHGGPFANIAHGCNTVIATNLARNLGDYVVTEAGFGADLGAEKFLDIKCRKAKIQPDAVVCVATMKALKYHGGLEKGKVSEENLEALKKGIPNLLKHVHNLKEEFGLNVIVGINKYITDSPKEINYLTEVLKEKGVNISLVEAWEKGGEGAKDLATQLVTLCEKPSKLHYTYELEDSITEKFEKVATKIYGAEGVEYTQEALESIQKIEKLGYSHLPICIAKTQYSLSDDDKNLECLEPFKIHVREVILKGGAEFIVGITGKIMTMPGLPRHPAAENIGIAEDGNTYGIF